MIQERSGVAAEGTGAGGNGSGSGATASGLRHPLRAYQTAAVERHHGKLAIRNTRLVLYAPTGAGKTRVAAELALIGAAAGLRVLIIAPRKEIVSQTYRTVVNHLPLDGRVVEADVGVIMGSTVTGLDRKATEALRRPEARIQVATVQTYSARVNPEAFAPDVVIIDECHHAHAGAKSYVGILEAHEGASVFGFSATPRDHNGRPLTYVFREIDALATVRELMAAGVLAEPLVYTHADARDLGLRDVEVSGGDFTSESLGPRMNRPRLVGNIVTHYQERVVKVRGRAVPTLCFAASVEHSKSIAARFTAAGFRAAHLDGKTHDDVRDCLIEDLEAGRLDVLCNYGVLTEGFDAPGVECVILARPTLKDHVYRQAVGRGMRKVEGCEKVVIVLDHAGLARAFGHPGEDVPVSLEEDPRCGTGRGADWKAPTKECLGCGQTVAASREVCPFCERGGAEAAGGSGSGGLKDDGGGACAGERFAELDGELVAMVRDQEMRGDGIARRMFRGEMRTAREVSTMTGMPFFTVLRHFREGRDIDKAVAEHRPKVTGRRMFRGEMRAAREVSTMTGMPFFTVLRHFREGRDIDKAVAEHRPRARWWRMFRGEMHTAREVSGMTDIPLKTVQGWFAKGLDIDKAVANHKRRRTN